MKIPILNRFTGQVIVEVEVDCAVYTTPGVKLGLAVKVALSLKANLRSSDLSCADLTCADLTCANLRSANLSDANLRSSDLRSADLTCADLTCANLSGANLRSANLSGADLSGANLSSADLTCANLPSPTAVLLANWMTLELSASLTADLMEYDAACHPNRSKFDAWAAGGACPYNGVRVQRACNFKESKSLWGRGQLHSAYALMLRLFQESGVRWS
jgi:Pentapeptide repeats (8 copies)